MGFENGSRTTISCSQEGRLWSHLIAYDMSEWVEWCHKVGDKLIDHSISTREPFNNLIVPKFMTERPALVPLAIEWGTSFFEPHEDEINISISGETAPFYDTRLDLISHTDSDPIRFRVTTGTQSATYELQFGERGVDYVPIGLDVADVSIRRRRGSLTEWFRKDSPIVFFADGSTLADHHLYTPPDIASRAPYPVERIVAWDWTGVDLKVESQTHARRADSIQRRVILDLLSSATNPAWDVVFDDDANEAADIVAIRSEGNRIIVHFYHCKYAHGEAPGARVGDLYEVCGQAQRSIRWKNSVSKLFRHLRQREEARVRRIGVTRFDRGDAAKLAELNRLARQVSTEFKVFIVQPGISKAEVSKSQLDLLAATELYFKDTSSIDLIVISSP
ncbi:hypothetical protein [Belnapia rosea]|uniref:hypothetical protein n=1 Tax=Belnapia rosea TaxID=938405 RepID=UPI0008844379|nr:hypothetical protein [Belnapia rosea]SDB74561.1 hypothetical protein SAMN02927895_05276 [Belnapia rosea]